MSMEEIFGLHMEMEATKELVQKLTGLKFNGMEFRDSQQDDIDALKLAINKQNTIIEALKKKQSQLDVEHLKNLIKQYNQQTVSEMGQNLEKQTSDIKDIPHLKKVVYDVVQQCILFKERISEMALNLEALEKEVTRAQTVQSSAVTLLTKLTGELEVISAQLAEKANMTPPEVDTGPLNDLIDKLKTSTDTLAAAVSDSTNVTPTKEVVLNANDPTKATVHVVMPEVLPENVTVTTEKIVDGPIDVTSPEPQIAVHVEPAPEPAPEPVASVEPTPAVADAIDHVVTTEPSAVDPAASTTIVAASPSADVPASAEVVKDVVDAVAAAPAVSESAAEPVVAAVTAVATAKPEVVTDTKAVTDAIVDAVAAAPAVSEPVAVGEAVAAVTNVIATATDAPVSAETTADVAAAVVTPPPTEAAQTVEAAPVVTDVINTPADQVDVTVQAPTEVVDTAKADANIDIMQTVKDAVTATEVSAAPAINADTPTQQ